jgi:hypothetical protein
MFLDEANELPDDQENEEESQNYNPPEEIINTR